MFLALDDELLKEYFAFMNNNGNDYDRNNIVKLFKYLQPFVILRSQKEDLGIEDALMNTYCDDGFMTIINDCDEETLIKNTKLKVMLTSNKKNYPYINILDDEVDVSFTATYKGGENRDKAKKHIKALLSDANEINIYDRYLSKVNHSNDSWILNKEILLDILPQKMMILNIYCEYNWNISRKNDLTSVYIDWTINKEDFDRNIHDRYIETDKVTILLSSGIINLASTLKDFTYIVKIK